jgi:hypothetical protein
MKAPFLLACACMSRHAKNLLELCKCRINFLIA